MIALAVIVGLILAGLSYQALGTYLDARRFPAPGRLIDVGPYRLHLNEQGQGNPSAVLEAGIAGSSLSWALVQTEVAKFTRVISYDRAGLGWSQKCAVLRTVRQMISELRALLSNTGHPGPHILVGHSFGGLLLRSYAHLHPGEVAGLMLLDPVSLNSWSHCAESQLKLLKRGASLSRRGAMLARFGIVRVALAALISGGRRFPKLVARVSAGQGIKVLEGLAGEVQKLPPEVWPMIRAHWSRPKCFLAMAEYLSCLPESARAALPMSLPEQLPVIILSASSATPEELKERDSWIDQSAFARHIRLDQCGHWIQLERPDVVVEAVRELVDLARKRSTS